MLASAALYFATATPNGVQLHQYGDFDLTTALDAGQISLTVRSGYPFDGGIKVTVSEAPTAEVELALRVPSWAIGTARLLVNGEAVVTEGGVATVARVFEPGDVIELVLPLEPRVTYPHPAIDAIRGTVAIERGPLVMCLESSDLPGGQSVDGVAVDLSVPLTVTGEDTQATVITRPVAPEPWPYVSHAQSDESDSAVSVNVVPYFSWANRGPSTMRVWIPVATS